MNKEAKIKWAENFYQGIRYSADMQKQLYAARGALVSFFSSKIRNLSSHSASVSQSAITDFYDDIDVLLQSFSATTSGLSPDEKQQVVSRAKHIISLSKDLSPQKYDELYRRYNELGIGHVRATLVFPDENSMEREKFYLPAKNDNSTTG